MSVTNEELYNLLEQAAGTATGKDDLDIAEFMMILEDEWITDVDSLRRLDGDALDELLPLLLSRELQRLMHHEDGRSSLNRNRRWRRSPPIKKRSCSKPRKSTASSGDKKEPSAPPGAIPVSEEESSSSSSLSNKDDWPESGTSPSARLVSPKPKPKAIYDKQHIMSTKKKKGSLFFKLFDILDNWCSSCSFKDDEESNNEILFDEGEGIDDDEIQQMSNSNPFMADASKRASHLIADASRQANIVANTKRKFPTREALEDAILECQAILVELEQEDATTALAASNNSESCDFVYKSNLISSTAEDELRKLYPLRLILPTVGDLTEMIGMLQQNREDAMRDLNMKSANSIQREISDIQNLIDEEERYLLKKRWDELECVACGERFTPSSKLRKKLVGDERSGGSITTKKTVERHCAKCREVFDNKNVEKEEQVPVLRRIETDYENGKDGGETESELSLGSPFTI